MRAGRPVVPGWYQHYWKCRVRSCQAVHWYRADKCQRCGAQLYQFDNPSYTPRSKKVE